MTIASIITSQHAPYPLPMPLFRCSRGTIDTLMSELRTISGVGWGSRYANKLHTLFDCVHEQGKEEVVSYYPPPSHFIIEDEEAITLTTWSLMKTK